MSALETLLDYAGRGWRLLPCKPKSKQPWTEHGKDDASADLDQIKAWYADKPGANWGFFPGPSHMVVLDCDPKNGGHDSDLDLPPTLTVLTPGDGYHFYLTLPEGVDPLPNSRGKLPAGWDVRSNGGYVMLPGSIHPNGGEYEYRDSHEDIAEIPSAILALITEDGKAEAAAASEVNERNVLKAHECLSRLKPERCDDYEQWLEVGMALSELGAIGLVLWDAWAQKSSKYQPGACAAKWVTFKPGSGLTLASLIHWAEADSGQRIIPPAPSKNARPSDVLAALHAMGLHFKLNEMSETLYVNGARLTDSTFSLMMTDLRENGYRGREMVQDAIVSEGVHNSFHPIRDYLAGLTWDGEDHIRILCSYIGDQDALFPLALRKWLIGAVQRVIGPRAGAHHPMLVLDGPQGIGKSRLVSWLGSPLPAHYMQSPISSEDKDFLVYQVECFVWEVEELGSTVRKQDREALKAFISKEQVRVRKAYGRTEIIKPPTASYIGTLNSEGGFLSDPTGNRRFRVVTIGAIDWEYSRLDVNQVWAQAVALSKRETADLTAEEDSAFGQAKERYEVDDPMEHYIRKCYDIDPAKADVWESGTEILITLRQKMLLGSGSDSGHARAIGAALTKLGAKRDQRRVDGQPTRVWLGVSRRLTI